MDAIEAEEFQDCSYYGIKLAEDAEDWARRVGIGRPVGAPVNDGRHHPIAFKSIRLGG
jgi:hypothetical protein